MILNTKGYSYNDLAIVPANISYINSRSQCCPYYENSRLPIFASCMSTVVDESNIETFESNSITPIIPRNISFEERIRLMNNEKWVAMSMSEFEELFIKNYKDRKDNAHYYICIDIANGHMYQLYGLCKEAKEKSWQTNYTLTIMTGNIANPETYDWICTLNTSNWDNKIDEDDRKIIDYIRVGIGTGSQCTTSSNTSIHYPIATLIDECRKIEWGYDRKYCPKIVADGGIRNYSDVIKALALGADYVMIGGLFAGMYESASPLVLGVFDHIGHLEYDECDYEYTSEEKKRKDIKNRNLFKECYGMSTKKAQELINKDSKKKTAEGKHSMIKVEYTLKQWTENMVDYLKSAMSYCGSYNLYDFIGNQSFIPLSEGTMLSINK